MKKIKGKWVVKHGSCLILVILFIGSFFVLLNERLNLLEVLIKPMENKAECIKIIDEKTLWSYMKEGENPGVGNVWATKNYNAKHWKKGYGDFGGGNQQETKTVLKIKEKNAFNISSYFFRYEFHIEDDILETIKAIEGTIEYDDAVIIYLNGAIIFAGNVPAGGYRSNLDRGAAETVDEKYKNSFEVTDLSFLKQGTNVIGVELHQENIESKDVYLNFQHLDLLRKELNEPIYDTDGLILEQGNTNEDIFIQWVTDSPCFFRIEYMEASNYKSDKDFSKYGKTVFMERKKIEEMNKYINRVQINRLKYNTEYLYRIFKIGSKKPSKSYQFKTGKRLGFSFVFLEGLDTLNKNFNEMQMNWEKRLNNTLSEDEDMDFIITSIHQSNKEKSNIQVMHELMMFRKPEILKSVPILITKGKYEDDPYANKLDHIQFNRKTENNQGNYYITYQDTLIISLNANDKDYKLHKTFIEDAIKKTKRKWVIIVTTIKEKDKEFFNMLDELNVDLVLNSKEYRTKVYVDNTKILIKNYSLKTGKQVKKYTLEK